MSGSSSPPVPVGRAGAVVLRGDAAHLPLPDASVDLIVTSPPYWKLRDYRDGGKSLKGQIGSEATPEEYIANLLRCTAEWDRVLKPSGSIFVVLGDKYSQPGKGERNMQGIGGGITHKVGARQANVSATGISYGAYPAKSLLFLPERYRIGCVTELGLIARAKIVWSKPNHMPESIDDRVAVAHEDIVHLVKRPRYFSAVDEIREPHLMRPQRRPNGRPEDLTPRQGQPRQSWPTAQRDEVGVDGHPLGKLPGTVWEIPTMPLLVPDRVAHARCCGGRKRPGCKNEIDHYAAYPPELVRRIILGWSPSGICMDCWEGRRPVSERTTVFDKARDQAHASEIAARGAAHSVMSGGTARSTLNGRTTRAILGYACACTPYADHPGSTGRERTGQGYARETGRDAHPHGGVGVLPRTGPWREYHLDGWVAPPTRPALVVDPFGGSGTTSLVADVFGRDSISLDLSGDYCSDIATWRINDPAERARALGVPKPPPVIEGQASLFDLEAS